MATILITQDLGLAARYCRRVVVMGQGRPSRKPRRRPFSESVHVHTKRLRLLAHGHIAYRGPRRTRREVVPLPCLPRANRAVLAQGARRRCWTCRALPRPRSRFAGGDRFSMTAAAGQSVGLVIIRPGKTTMSRMICRLIDPSEGVICSS
jgi:peptide/nickel transport system ATP-binding protein